MDIREWNEDWRGIRHAKSYISFLTAETKRLAASVAGRRVPESELQYEILQRRSKRFAHVVIFKRMGDELHVVRYFHSSQDWRGYLESQQ